MKIIQLFAGKERIIFNWNKILSENIEALGSFYIERQRQLCDDAGDSVLIKNKRVARKSVATPFWSDSIVFNENSIASDIAELSQGWRWRLV